MGFLDLCVMEFETPGKDHRVNLIVIKRFIGRTISEPNLRLLGEVGGGAREGLLNGKTVRRPTISTQTSKN